MDSFKCVPAKRIKYAVIFSVLCIVFGAAMLIMSVLVSRFLWIYQLTFTVMGISAIHITARFIIPDYIYVLDREDFIIIKKNGKKAVQVCNVNLSTGIALTEEKNFREIEKNHGAINIRRRFCQNIFAEQTCMYIFNFNEKKAALIFEPDSAFIEEFRRRLEMVQGNGDAGESK